MDNDDLVLEPQVETVPTTETVEVDASALLSQLEKEKEARRQLTARAKASEDEVKALKAQMGTPSSTPLAVEDYIDISTSLEGLDAREKAFLAEQHKQSGKTLSEIRQGEDFQLWQTAYRLKQEKENALKPSAVQAVEEGPKSINDRLRTASLEEKEAILREAGLYKEFRPRADRTNIGITR